MTYIKQQFVLDLDSDYENEKQTSEIMMDDIKMIGSNFLEYQEVELTEEMIDNYFGIKKSRISNSKQVGEQDEIQNQLEAVEINNENEVDTNLSGGRKLEDVIEDLSGKRKINLTGGLQSVPNEKLMVYPYSLF